MSKQNLKALASLTKYTLIATLRNPSALFFGFLFPFIFIAVFGLIGQGSSSYSIGVSSDSVKQGVLYDALNKIEGLKLVTDKSDSDLQDELSKGQLPGVITIEEVRNNVNGVEVISYKLNLKTTSAAPQDSAIVQSILSNVVSQFNNPPNENQFKLVELNTEKIEGRKYSTIDFILPGQLNFSLMSTGIFSITFSLLTLRKTLVLKRMYATPTPKWVILGAKALSSLVVALMQSTLIILVGHFLFNFTLINGIWTFLAMLGMASIGLLVFLSMGLFAASLADSEDSVSPIVNLMTMPQFLLGGTFFSIEIFPAFLKPIASVMPIKFLNDAMRAIAFEGAGLDKVLPDILALLVTGAIIYAIVIKIFKWE